MASSDVNRLMDNLRVRLPGAVDDTIRLELYNALNQFFRGSNIWCEQIDVPVSSGITSYDITPSGNAKIVRLMSIVNDANTPIRASINIIDFSLELAETPNTSTTYYATVSLTVDDPVNAEGYPNFPAWVFSLYQENIIDGVLSRMMSQPAKPYSNTQLAVLHERRFASAIALARAEAQRQYVYGGQAWKFPQTFNRRKSYR